MCAVFATTGRADGALVDEYIRNGTHNAAVFGGRAVRTWIGSCESAALARVDDETLGVYIDNLRTQAAHRRFLDLARDVSSAVTNREPVTAIATSIGRAVEGIVSGAVTKRAKTSAELARRFSVRQQEASKIIVERVPLGIPAIDKANRGGCRMGSVVLVGADTGVGKSTFTAHMALAALLAGYRVNIDCFETPVDEVYDGVVQMLARVPLADAVSGEDFGNIASANGRLAGMPLMINDVEAMTAEEYAANIHAFANDDDERGVVMFCDYVQDLEKSTRHQRDDLNHMHISKTLRRATLRARRGNRQRVLLVQLSQLSEDDGNGPRTRGKPAAWEGPVERNVAGGKQYVKDASYIIMVDRNKNSDDEDLKHNNRVRQIKVRPRDSTTAKTWMRYDPATGTLFPSDGSGHKLTATVEVDVPDDNGWSEVDDAPDVD